jgi:hypothetical protein
VKYWSTQPTKRASPPATPHLQRRQDTARPWFLIRYPSVATVSLKYRILRRQHPSSSKWCVHDVTFTPSESGSSLPLCQGELEKDLKTDPPCHPRACAIQSMLEQHVPTCHIIDDPDCIQRNNYNEEKCRKEVRSWDCSDQCTRAKLTMERSMLSMNAVTLSTRKRETTRDA